MLRVFRHHVSVSALTGMIADVLLCFIAILLAASSLSGTSGAAGARFLTCRLSCCSRRISLVMSLMYAFVGLYRPTPIGFPAMLRRTLFARAPATVTYLMLQAVADRGYVKQLIASAIVC